MELQELLSYRNQIIDESHDVDGYISDTGFLDSCLPWLNETKHTDTTDVNNVYDPLENGTIKVNAYVCNESGERLQLFLVNEESLSPDASQSQIMVSQKAIYEKQFARTLNFVRKAIKKQLHELLQEGSPAWILIHQLNNQEFLDQIDVIEVFLLSATATIESRGTTPSAKMLEFEDDLITVGFMHNGQRKVKELVVMKRLIDLNYLYNVHISQSNRYPLIIDFSAPPFNYPIPFLQAACEPEFDSYLCALPATLLVSLYQRYSSRLLEKNVRSFLQLKGVNKGMQDTVRKEPEKFIAYNNGLTITATASEKIEINGISHLKQLTDFQIVNGGQTTATLYFSKKAGLNIERIKIMAKINVAKNASDEILDELISNISTFSNAQSKVSKVDLRARSQQLVKLKSLSESILTTSGKKWFFERARGEYATMLRINAKKKAQFEKTFPKERRFTKEELAKYYASWGDKPYAVKKGGEKIFRLFLEEISGEGKNRTPVNITRDFYEDLIARIILFRNLETIYGSGNNSLGQLRSAVVPYSLSALYTYTSGNRKADPFDLLKIWKAEKIDDELLLFFKDLMKLMNNLIKLYSKSDDLGEYSKKPELWDAINISPELKNFMASAANIALIKRYAVSATELKRREKESRSFEIINFEPLLEIATVFDRGVLFYKKIENELSDKLTESQSLKLTAIISAIQQTNPIDESVIEFQKVLLKQVSLDKPNLLQIEYSSDLFTRTVYFIIKEYNSAIRSGLGIQHKFDLIREIANKKGAKYYSVFGEIGKTLTNNCLPSIQQIKQACEYCKLIPEQ